MHNTAETGIDLVRHRNIHMSCSEVIHIFAMGHIYDEGMHDPFMISVSQIYLMIQLYLRIYWIKLIILI